jgi:protocatechuate 4,5-dioxygenase beta chain
MAQLIGGLGTSHVPSIAAAIDRGLRDTPDWKPFFDGYLPGQDWVRAQKPDIAVVIFNDHGNSFFLDKVPTFAIGCAESYAPVDEGWGPRPIPPFEGAVDFSWHLADTLVENRFDPMICQEIEVDHGIQVPMELFWGRPERWPVKVVPIFVNVIQHPIPLPARCYEMGRVLRRAIESYAGNERIIVVGTGGLSHQLQGARAGFVNPDADRAFLRDIATAPERYAGMSREDYVETFGSEGAELMMWLVMRGAMNRDVSVKHTHYFVPASMTGAGMIVLENAGTAG